MSSTDSIDSLLSSLYDRATALPSTSPDRFLSRTSYDPDDYLDDMPDDSDLFVSRGIITFAPQGFAFVRPTNASGGDIFVPPNMAGGAVTGDTVRILVGMDSGGRYEGCVDEICERGITELFGEVSQNAAADPILIYKGRELGHPVLFADAQDLPPVGSLCWASVVEWPDSPGSPITVLASRYCESPGSPDNAVAAICTEYRIPMDHGPDTLLETWVIPSEITEQDLSGRADHRHLHFVTIDGETSRDFDDAVYCESDTAGGLRLFVAIADVAHYVKESSEMQSEAYHRGTSVYFPDLCVPMLPEAISNGICSLNEGADRLVVVCEMLISADGEIVSYEFSNSVIRSRRRLTYEDVDRMLAGRADAGKAFASVLSLMDACWRTLNKKRMARGALDFDLAESELPVPGNCAVVPSLAYTRSDSHRLIEEFMLAANESAAAMICSYTGQSLLRVHKSPEPARIRELLHTLASFGIKISPEMLGTPAALLRLVIQRAATIPERDIILSAALRSMQKAIYACGCGDENSLHFSLQTCLYTHFTSPIRRYPDLVAHRHIKTILAGGSPDFDGIGAVADQCSAREKVATAAERAMAKRLQARIMAAQIGKVFDGMVTGITRRGIYASFGEPRAEGMITTDSLEVSGVDYQYANDTFSVFYNESKQWMPYRLGTKVKVRVAAADELQRTIDLNFA